MIVIGVLALLFACCLFIGIGLFGAIGEDEIEMIGEEEQ